MRNWRSIISSSTINIICWVGGLFFIVSIDRWALTMESQWDSSSTNVQWPLLFTSLGIAFVGHAVQSEIGFVSQRYIGYSAPRAVLYRTWFFSQVAKYIPGGIWQVAARSTAYHRRGVPLLLASTTTLWEIAAIFAGALLVTLFGAQALNDTNLRLLIAAISLLLLLGILLSLTPLPWQILCRLGLKRANAMLLSLKSLGAARYKMFLTMVVIAVVSWLLIGLAFYLLVQSIIPAGKLPVPDAMAVFLVAWIVGFLALPTPSGLGVREAVMSALLVAYVPLPMTLLIAIAARLWWVAAEGANIGLAALWQAAIIYWQRSTKPVPLTVQSYSEAKQVPIRNAILLTVLIFLGAGSLATGTYLRGHWAQDVQTDQPSAEIEAQQNPVKGLDDDPVTVYCNHDQPGIDVWRRQSWGIDFLHSFPQDDLDKAASHGVSAQVDGSSTLTMTLDGTDRYFLSFEINDSTGSNGYFGKSFTC